MLTDVFWLTKKNQPRSHEICFFFNMCEGKSEMDQILWEWGWSQIENNVFTRTRPFLGKGCKYIFNLDLAQRKTKILQIKIISSALCEKCPNTEIFLVLIFPRWDWTRRFTGPNTRNTNTDQKKHRTRFCKVKLAMFGFRAFVWDVKPQLASAGAFYSAILWVYSLNNLISALEARKGVPFNVYIGFHDNIGLIS